MNNLKIVFKVIKEACDETGISSEECFTRLENLLAGRQEYLSLYLYLEVLYSLGLIKFYSYNRKEMKISLTEKGKKANDKSIYNLQAYSLLVMYFIRRAFFYILFWPAFKLVHTPYSMEENHENQYQ